MKIPPRAIFTIQIIASIFCSLISVTVVFTIYELIGIERMSNNPPLGWNGE
jgi:hypothetical protein